MANDNPAKKISLDLTRLRERYEIEGITTHIKDNSKVSVLVNHRNLKELDISRHNTYNLYGYIDEISDNSNKESKVNYSSDIARTIKLKNKPKNRYSNYKYAYHYPLVKANYTKFSRYNSNGFQNLFYLRDFYSLLSFFDSTTHSSYYYTYLPLDNSNYYDFYSISSNTNKDIVDPISYHGRDIYMDANMLYLKIESNSDFYRQETFAPYKYMIIELSKKYSGNIKLEYLFSLCRKHAYLLNDSGNKLDASLPRLLANCKATKFGDPDDARTLLNASDVYDITSFCHLSNIEDLSMHTINMTNDKYGTINLNNAFAYSKIRKLPKGLLESIKNAGGYQTLYAESMFENAKDIEMDLSTIEIPTKGDSPSDYILTKMYSGSNCRHVNRMIKSTNESDIISAEKMYAETNIVETTPLPSDIFKNYKKTYGMFDKTIFENLDTFKYICMALAASGRNNKAITEAAIKADNRPNYKLECPIVSFRLGSQRLEDTIESLSISGDRGYRSLEIHADRVVSLDIGLKLVKLKEFMDTKRNDSTFTQHPNEISPEYDFTISREVSSYDATFSFFLTLNPPRYAARYRDKYCPIFRSIRFLMCGENYYELYENIFKQIFSTPPDRTDSRHFYEYDRASALFCASNTKPDMMTLTELSDDKYMNILKSNLLEYCNACATISINGLHTKWTAYRPHINKFTKEKGYKARLIGQDVDKFFNCISVFTDAVHLKKCIMAQKVMTPTLSAENKIEFIFKARDSYELVRFLKLMDEHLAINNEPDKLVGRFLLLYDGRVFDSSNGIPKVLYTIGTEHAESAKADLAAVNNYWD